MIDTYNLLSPIFINFTRINVLTILMKFSVLLVKNSVNTRSSKKKKLKLTFQKTKLGIQSLSYVGPNSWNSLPGNLKSATSANSFKHYIKEYFLKKLGKVGADIYSYT